MKKLLHYVFHFSAMRICVLVALMCMSLQFVVEFGVFPTGLFSKSGFLYTLELFALDQKMKARGDLEIPDSKVSIAAIDERSLEEFGLWPWSRTVMAQMIDKLGEYGARVIAFDIIFADEDRNSAYQSIKKFREMYLAAGLAKEQEVPEEGEEEQEQPKAKEEAELVKNLDRAGRNARQLEKLLGELEDHLDKVPPAQRKAAQKTLADAKKEAKGQLSVVRLSAKDAVDYMSRSQGYFDKLSEAVQNVSPDALLAQSVKNAREREVDGGTSVILGMFAFETEEDLQGTSAADAKRGVDAVADVHIDQLYYTQELEDGSRRIDGIDMEADTDAIRRLVVSNIIGIQSPLPILIDASQEVGFFNIGPDPDGVMRRETLFLRYDNKLLAALVLKAVNEYNFAARPDTGGIIRPIVSPYRDDELAGTSIDDSLAMIPTDPHGRMLLNYYGDPIKSFPNISIVDIVKGTVPDPSLIKGKIIFVGATHKGGFDQRNTPFNPFVPGVAIHATAAQNILDHTHIVRPRWVSLLELSSLMFFGLLMGFALPRMKVGIGAAVLVLLAVARVAIDASVIFPQGVWAFTLFPLYEFGLAYMGVTTYRYFTEEKQKRYLRSAFQTYLSPAVVEQLVKDPTQLKLGGKRSDLTVMFSDIRGFTTISEALTPEELTALLNDYLTPMTDLVFLTGGTLDKYMGDAIMAFWGAPIEQSDHPIRACTAALQMMEKLKELQAGWEARKVPKVDIGIGINTGPMSVGNMGSTQRMDYTVMGDSVNLGSRVEGINKEYGTHIIVTEFTLAAAGGPTAIGVRELDSVKVKGKDEPVVLYELLGVGAMKPETQKWVDLWNQGLAAYRDMNWDGAEALFKQCIEVRGGDPTSKIYYEKRIPLLREHPPAGPGEKWDGVWKMTTK